MNPKWKQPTPLHQLQVMVMAMEGHASNYQEKIIGECKFADVSYDLIQELVELLPFVIRGKWD